MSAFWISLSGVRGSRGDVLFFHRGRFGVEELVTFSLPERVDEVELFLTFLSLDPIPRSNARTDLPLKPGISDGWAF